MVASVGQYVVEGAAAVWGPFLDSSFPSLFIMTKFRVPPTPQFKVKTPTRPTVPICNLGICVRGIAFAFVASCFGHGGFWYLASRLLNCMQMLFVEK